MRKELGGSLKYFGSRFSSTIWRAVGLGEAELRKAFGADPRPVKLPS